LFGPRSRLARCPLAACPPKPDTLPKSPNPSCPPLPQIHFVGFEKRGDNTKLRSLMLQQFDEELTDWLINEMGENRDKVRAKHKSYSYPGAWCLEDLMVFRGSHWRTETAGGRSAQLHAAGRIAWHSCVQQLCCSTFCCLAAACSGCQCNGARPRLLGWFVASRCARASCNFLSDLG
jgi:hypothetical protein